MICAVCGRHFCYVCGQDWAVLRTHWTVSNTKLVASPVSRVRSGVVFAGTDNCIPSMQACKAAYTPFIRVVYSLHTLSEYESLDQNMDSFEKVLCLLTECPL